MPKPTRFADVRLDVEPGARRAAAERADETPFRILLMGDFSGREQHENPLPVRWKPILVDRDNFDEVLAGMGVEIILGAAGQRGRIRLPVRDLDDFHPDQIYTKAECFRQFREARAKLKSAPSRPPSPGARGAKAPDAASLATGSLLDQIVAGAEPAEAAASRPKDELQEFIERAVAPHLEPAPDERTPALVAEVDAQAAALMRAILHHPHFQAIEAAWRGMFFLVRHLDTDRGLKLYLLDVSKADLAKDLSGSAVEDSHVYRLLVEEAAHTIGAEPWAVVAGNYVFQRCDADARLLARMAAIMQAGGAAFIAEGDPGVEATAEWTDLRRSPSASWIGLAMPRFLLRLPYGRGGQIVDSFAFEEMPGEPRHQDYLWGNPAFACVRLLGEAFNEDGWHIHPGSVREIRGLPLHIYESGGERVAKPCAELLMTEEEAEWALEQGFMPLASLKNQDAVLLLRFQSIADPPAALSGPWG